MTYFLASKSVPVVAASSSIVFAVSPWQTVRTIARARSTLQFPFAPFFFYFVQSVIFTLYAYATGNLLMGSTAGLGSVLGLHYVLVYYRHAADKAHPFRLLVGAMMGISALWLATYGKTVDQAKMIIGVPGNILAVLTSVSPLLTVRTIIARRDASSLPFGMSVMNMVAGSVWTVYGTMLGDMLVIFPNAIALTMGTIQVSLIILFRPSAKAVAHAPTISDSPKSTAAPLRRKLSHEKV